MKSCEEDTSSKFSSSNFCSINLAPSKDGGTCMRKLNEKKRKMHNLKTKCGKKLVKNISIDGFPISTKLCKINK
jgi:hypothetical protein